MTRKARNIFVTEIPGNQHQTLQDAQQAALAATAHDLANTIHRLLASGRLVNVNGKITPNHSR